MSDFDFKEFEKFAKNFEKANKEFELFLKKFLLEMAFRVIAKVKPQTPVITGALKAMWGIGSQNIVVKENTDSSLSVDTEKSTVATVDMVGNNFEIMIWNAMEYASFVEYGARNRNGTWRDGNFVMTISVDEVNKQMPSRFIKAWKQFLIEKGVG